MSSSQKFQIYQSHSRRPAEGNKLADAAVPQVQAAPGENSCDRRNRGARRVCDPQMSGHRAAEIAGHDDCGESTPNCFAYSAFNRCQPANFMASAPTMRPIKY